MNRYFINCAYLGSKYVGWQRQPNGISVQEEIEKAFSVIFQADVKIHGSSRTDAGVHAEKQIAHVDLPFQLDDLEATIYKLNNLLPFDIAINDLCQVADDYHSRFEAIGRKYSYKIHTFKSPFKTNNSYYFRPNLDIELMNLACKLLVQATDFESFSKVKTSVNNFNCSIEIAEWKATDSGYRFTIQANRFLRGMVRAIVGTMIEVGSKKISLETFEKIIKSKDRSAAGRNVPAQGLTLVEVLYPIIHHKEN